jgi:hypothetical protein
MTITVTNDAGQLVGTVTQDGASWHAKSVRGYTIGWSCTVQGAVLLLTRPVIRAGEAVTDKQVRERLGVEYLTPGRLGQWGLGSVT